MIHSLRRHIEGASELPTHAAVRLLASFAAAALLSACSGTSDNSADAKDVKNDWNLMPNPEKVDFSLPGKLVVDGNPVPTGTPIGWVVNALGEPELTRDMGAAGLLLVYPKWSLEVLVALPPDALGMPADDPNGGAGNTPADDPNGAGAQEPPPPVKEVVAFHLLPGFAGKTPDGLGLGIDEAALTKALGTPLPDPFGQGIWFPDVGLFAQVSGGKVTMITLSEPAN